MAITKEDLENLTLKSKVYHPIHGEGDINDIHKNSIDVVFNDNTNGSYYLTKNKHPLIKDEIPNLYLKPVKVVFEEDLNK